MSAEVYANGFRPGVDVCGLPGAAPGVIPAPGQPPRNYEPCCPDGVDCAPVYGNRVYCSCSVQTAEYKFLSHCRAYQIPAMTAAYPTKCEAM